MRPAQIKMIEELYGLIERELLENFLAHMSGENIKYSAPFGQSERTKPYESILRSIRDLLRKFSNVDVFFLTLSLFHVLNRSTPLWPARRFFKMLRLCKRAQKAIRLFAPSPICYY